MSAPVLQTRVNSESDKHQIAGAAAKVAPAGKIDNQLEVNAPAPDSTGSGNLQR